MAFLEIANIQKRFAQTTAVEQVDLEVTRGEFVSFLGPSGCGKSTTLRIIAGFESPSAGVIRLDGVDITRRPPNQRHVGMVFQSYALFPNMTIAQNVGFGLKVAKKPAAEIARRVDEMLNLIKLPALGHRYPYQLSGGQQQRVALARALAIQPQVLLLDEPLSALDAKIRVSLRNEIRSIQRKLDITTIYVTHDQEEALSLSDRIAVMNEGRVEQVGTPFEIYNFPRTAFVAAFVGTLNILHGHVADPAQGKIVVDGQELMASRGLEHARMGDVCSVALRPEVVSLGEAAKDGNQMRGTVEDVNFLGSIVRIRLRLKDNVISLDTFNNPRLSLPERGQTLTVNFSPEAVLVLEAPSST
ncbi:MAG TPA: ABC transporter ATP-binding protein [bacterium]|jgi:putative spermidine/putrescine transport system ATP-binding protein|nr:ABC transporter ATP-binding protein [bacterium]